MESREFKNDSANQSFTMSPSRWISMTTAKQWRENNPNLVGNIRDYLEK